MFADTDEDYVFSFDKVLLRPFTIQSDNESVSVAEVEENEAEEVPFNVISCC